MDGQATGVAPRTEVARSRWLQRVALGVVVFILGSISALAFLTLSPLGTVAVEVEAEFSAPGYTQMFFSGEGQVFTERASRRIPVSVGTQRVRFPISRFRDTLGEYIRWDPLQQPARVSVTSLKVASSLASESIATSAIVPSLDVSEVRVDGDVARLETLSSDGQVLLDMDLVPIYEATRNTALMISLVFGALLTGTVLLISVSTQRITTGTPGSADQQFRHPREDVLSVRNILRTPVLVGVFLTVMTAVLASWVLVIE